MKKKILLILPVLVGLFATSCSNDPKTEPIERQDFVQNLNTVKKKAAGLETTKGMQISASQALDTSISYKDETLKLSIANETKVKAYNNKVSASNTTTVSGKSLIDEKPTSVKASLKTNLYTELTDKTVNMLLDINGSATQGETPETIDKKVRTSFDIDYSDVDLQNLKETITADYAKFTEEYVDVAIAQLQETPLAKLGYVKKGETEVFTLNFDLNANDMAVSKTEMKLRFDGYFLTKFELATTNVLTQDGNEVTLNAATSLHISEYSKEITLPDASDYQEVTEKDLEQILKELEF